MKYRNADISSFLYITAAFHIAVLIPAVCTVGALRKNFVYVMLFQKKIWYCITTLLRRTPSAITSSTT